MELYFVGYQGDEGTQLLLKHQRETLEKRFSGAYLAQAEDVTAPADKAGIRAVLERYGADCREVQEGGVLRTLFELAKEENLGLTVDEGRIPLHQETVEFCELFDVNPYTVASRGSYVVRGAQDGFRAELEALGVRVERIGETVPGKKKTLLRYGEAQCLNRQKKDPLKELGLI